MRVAHSCSKLRGMNGLLFVRFMISHSRGYAGDNSAAGGEDSLHADGVLHLVRSEGAQIGEAEV